MTDTAAGVPKPAKQTAAKRPAAKKAAAKKPVAKKAVAKKAGAEQAQAERPAARRPAARKTSGKTPSALRNAVDGQSLAESAAASAAPVQPGSAATQPSSADYVIIDPLWLERAYRLGVGSAVLAAAGGGRVLGVPGGQFGEALPTDEVIDFGVGLSDSLFGVVQRTVDRVSRAVAPVVGALRPPFERVLEAIGEALAPAMEPIAERGRRRRAEAEAEMASLIEALIPDITDLMLERIDLQAVLSRIDLQELVEASLEHIDMQSVMAKLDMEQAAEQMMGQLDLTQIALDHVDMNRIMDNAIKQVDMVALVRSQLEGMDLTDLLFTTPTSLASGALRQTTRFVRRG